MNVRAFGVLVLAFCCSSCATVLSGRPPMQRRVDALVVSGEVVRAADLIAARDADYGTGNFLLYYLDRGLVEFYAGRHPDSIRSFEKARQRFLELYTTSLSKEALSWVLNDGVLPYRGADHEYVLLNVFQALNYLAQGNVEEALVEARDMDARFRVVVDAAAREGRARFEDNGFARLFMGLVCEASGRADDRSEALLFYRQALRLYQGFDPHVPAPALLRFRATALARAAGVGAPDLQDIWSGPLPEESGRAVVNVFQLAGLAPLKEAVTVPLPVGPDLVTEVSLPVFSPRPGVVRGGALTATDEAGRVWAVGTEYGVSVDALATLELEARKALVLAKGLARPALKALVEHQQRQLVEERYGAAAGQLFGLAASLYNVVTERADLRSWHSLPSEIRLGRLALPPGIYRFTFRHLAADGRVVEEDDLGKASLVAGRALFLVARSGR